MGSASTKYSLLICTDTCVCERVTNLIVFFLIIFLTCYFNLIDFLVVIIFRTCYFAINPIVLLIVIIIFSKFLLFTYFDCELLQSHLPAHLSCEPTSNGPLNEMLAHLLGVFACGMLWVRAQESLVVVVVVVIISPVFEHLLCCGVCLCLLTCWSRYTRNFAPTHHQAYTTHEMSHSSQRHCAGR